MLAFVVFALCSAVAAGQQFAPSHLPPVFDPFTRNYVQRDAPAPVFQAPAVAQAAPTGFASTNPQATIIQRTYQNDDNGFLSDFSSSDGISFNERGHYEPTNDQLDKVLTKEGSFRYTSPEGTPVEISYTADRYGFHPQGNALPQQQAVPAVSF